MADLKKILIGDIAQNPVALRNVDRQSEKFIQLRDSIAAVGVLNAINVRPSKEGSEKAYELIDGLHRFMASLEAGIKEIPAQIFSMDDAAVLEAQLMANVHTVKTKPVEFAKQIQRILAGKPMLTISELSKSLAVSPGFVNERLGLLKLDKAIADLVDSDGITLTNAYALAKLPPEDQKNLLQAASTEQPSEFVPRVQQRVKEIREATRAGKSAEKVGFLPTPKVRKRSELVTEMEAPKIIPALVKQSGIKDPIQAAQLIIKWVLQMDDASIESSKAKFEQREKELEAAKAKRKAEKDAQKAEESAKVAATVNTQ